MRFAVLSNPAKWILFLYVDATMSVWVYLIAYYVSLKICFLVGGYRANYLNKIPNINP
jgi:hypothetical protein